MGSGHKIVLWMTILWEGMFYRKTFLMGGHFLLEVMSYERICLTGHALGRTYLRGGHVLQEDVFLDNINSTGRICLSGGHIL